MSHKLNQKFNRPSFSLLEIILLIALVAVAFLGVSSLLRQTLQLEGLIKNDFIGNALADEGIALVEAVRNNNVVNLPPGQEFQNINMSNETTTWFKIDKALKNTAPIPLGASDFVTENSRLYFSTSMPNDYYSHTNSGTATNFYRIIFASRTLDPYGGGNPIVRVTSVVTLKYRGKTYTYVRYTILR